MITEARDLIAMKIKIIKVLKKDLERIEKKTRRDRKYYEIKKIVKSFVQIFQYLISDIFKYIAAQKVEDWTLQLAVDILKESYQIILIEDERLLDILKDVESYYDYPYKELELRIYKKLPEYCKIMMKTLSFSIGYLEERDKEWIEVEKKQNQSSNRN